MSSVSGGDTRSFSLPSARRPRDGAASWALPSRCSSPPQQGSGPPISRWKTEPLRGGPHRPGPPGHAMARPMRTLIPEPSWPAPASSPRARRGLAFTATRDSADQRRWSGGAPTGSSGGCRRPVPGPSLRKRETDRSCPTPPSATASHPARSSATAPAASPSCCPAPQPGNWLPLGVDGRFEVVLRLYDTPVSATAAALDPGASSRGSRGRACRRICVLAPPSMCSP